MHDGIGRTAEEQSREGWWLVAGLAASAGCDAEERVAIAAAAMGALWQPWLASEPVEPVTDSGVSGLYEARVRERVGAKAARRALGIYYTPAEAAARLVASTGWSQRSEPVLRCADAACGTGELLVAAWDAAPAGAEVQCFGLDVDPVAVAVTRARLMLRCRAAGVDASGVAARVVSADALAVEPPWPAAFTLVVGNPPFGNAIEKETARSATETAALRRRFPHAARGAFDRAALFAELSLDWAMVGGEVALVLPRTMQSVAYAAGVRAYWSGRAAVEVIGAEEPIRFAGAQVAVSFWVARGVGEASGGARWVSDGRAWWEPWMQGWPTDWQPLGEVVHLQSGATVAEAYAFADRLTEGGEGFRFVTAGALDPHRVAWGERQRYLGRDWQEPRLAAAAAGRRSSLYARPKVCVAALSRVLEAVTDEAGDLAAAVSVLVGWPREASGRASLLRLALLLNSALVRLRYQTENGPQAMAGGSVPVSKQKLLALTVPTGWFGAQPPAVVVPSGFAEGLAGLPALPDKRLPTAEELANFAEAVRRVGVGVQVWEAALTAGLSLLPPGGAGVTKLQPLSDGCLMAHYLCLTGEESASSG